ncbi:MAG: hypothetical protein ACJ73J_05385 [Actinomycetes bacterium]
MAPNDIYLHIGAPKTGTTYLQDMLWANKDILDQSGVLVPGHYRYARVPAIREVLKWNPDASEPLPDRWLRIAQEIKRWHGPSAVLSQEFICRLSEAQTHALVASLARGNRGQVHCILTVRDISRLLTAQWQTAMRSRKHWTLTDYCAAAAGTSTEPNAAGMHDHFWIRHNYQLILNRWIDEVGAGNITVVTVPQSGADPEELWRRFCEACGIDASATGSAEPTHESLGAASAELMRRLNQNEVVRSMNLKTYQQSVNTAISRRGLVDRRSKEPKLSLPPEFAEWASQSAQETVDLITSARVRVIGDLDDLRPSLSAAPAVNPEELPPGVLLEACIDGLAGLAVEHAKLSHTGEPGRRAGGRTGHADAEGTSTLKRARAAWRRRAPIR